MSDRFSEVLVDDLEITLDFLGSESVATVFLGELVDRRNDLLQTLIDTGEQEARFKIQMIDEVFGIQEEVMNELKSRKDNME